jgi:hypothetical protein
MRRKRNNRSSGQKINKTAAKTGSIKWRFKRRRSMIITAEKLAK